MSPNQSTEMIQKKVKEEKLKGLKLSLQPERKQYLYVSLRL